MRLDTIKAVSFDLDDTLYDNRPIIKIAEFEFYQFLLTHFPKSKQWQQSDWIALKQTLITLEPELAHDPTKARTATLSHGLNVLGYKEKELTLGVKKAMDCFNHYRSDFEIDNDVIEMLTQWAKNVPLIGITNGNVNASKIGLNGIFKFVLSAGNGINMKPMPDMFELASRKLKLKPSQILHVGDSWQSDVQGARLAGFQSAWLNPSFGNNQKMNREKGLLPHIELSHLFDLNSVIQ